MPGCWRKCCYWIGPVNRNFFLALFLFLASCQSAPTSTPLPTATYNPPATATTTSTSTAIPTGIPTATSTPEPVWYQPLDPALDGLKYQYAEVINKRAKIYASLPDAAGKTGNYGYLPKFPAYVAYSSTEVQDGSTYYFLPVNYAWMNGEDLQPLTPSTFSGITLAHQLPFRFGWVLAETHSIGTTGEPVHTFQRYQVVHEVPTSAAKPGYITIGADEWLPEEGLALVSPAVPAEAGPNTRRLIYANLASQTLSVFDNNQLVFATLISSGKNSWTFEGSFAIQYKVEYNSINPPEWSTSEYYIQAVPYMMFYYGDFGFHAAYWHDNFGTAASHGCINLSPKDAKWLYNWAGEGDRVIISAGT
jgi:hypothetical protein